MSTISNKTPSTQLEWLELGKTYLELGWSIIPIGSEKKPLIKWKEFQDKKPALEDVQKWSAHKNLTGYALVTGKTSSVVVLDLDQGSKFDAKVLPSTPHSQTGSGGHHYFFRQPDFEIPNATSFIEKTDFRGEGGYAILPPSKHPSGNQYFWLESPDEVPFAEMPVDLIEQLRQPPVKDKLSATVKSEENIFEGVGESKRNDSAAKVVGFLLKYLPQDEWQRVALPLLQAWNQLNKPPLQSSEIEAVYSSISQKAVNSPQGGSERPSQAQILVGMVLSSPIKLFTNQFKEPVLTLPKTPFLSYKIDSDSTKQLLFKMYWDQEGKPPGSEAVSAVIKTLQGIATFDRPAIEVFNRVGRKGKAIYYDMGDNTHIVKITADGWSVEVEAPVYFRRFSHQQPQVLPKRGGNLREITQFMNIKLDEHKLLVLTFLVASLIPDIPRAMLILHGDQGSAKSTLLRLLRELIDPSQVALLTPPDSIRELVQFASHHYALFLDNLSDISPSLSDALCRLITGDGFTKRQLFTDDEDVLYAYKRVAGICGINQVATRPDLLDRSIIVPLERIPDSQREEEKFLWHDFEELKPMLLGSLFDAVATTLKLAPTLKLHTKPRMADYFKYATSAAMHFGFTEGDLLGAFNQNVRQQNEEAVESSAVAQTLIEFMSNQTNDWIGKSSELFDVLEAQADKLKIKKGFPKSPNWLWRKIKDVRPNLMAYGLDVTKNRELAGTYITISKQATSGPKPETAATATASTDGNTGSIGNKNEENMEEMVRDTLF